MSRARADAVCFGSEWRRHSATFTRRGQREALAAVFTEGRVGGVLLNTYLLCHRLHSALACERTRH